MNTKYHETVLTREVVEALLVNKNKGEWFIDTTLGTGGHSEAILKAGGAVLGLDADPLMVATARQRLKGFGGSFKALVANFIDLTKVLNKEGVGGVAGIIFDLGVSNIHLTGDDRGFSFSDPERVLDMRLNPEVQGVSAKDLLNALREDQLKEMFLVTMKYPEVKSLVGKVIGRRAVTPFTTVGDFLSLFGARTGRIHPATKAFLALRMTVNMELPNLKSVLPEAYNALKVGGRLAVISFHSGEDIIVKDYFELRRKEGDLIGDLIVPTESEVNTNPRARSARLRFLEKI